MGDGRRILRVEKALREIISSYLISGFRHPLPAMASIPFVKASGDLKSAKVFVSLIAAADIDEKEQGELMDETVEILNENAWEIQSQIAKTLPMKSCPKLRFFSDEFQKEALKVDAKIRELSTTED